MRLLFKRLGFIGIVNAVKCLNVVAKVSVISLVLLCLIERLFSWSLFFGKRGILIENGLVLILPSCLLTAWLHLLWLIISLFKVVLLNSLLVISALVVGVEVPLFQGFISVVNVKDFLFIMEITWWSLTLLVLVTHSVRILSLLATSLVCFKRSDINFRADHDQIIVMIHSISQCRGVIFIIHFVQTFIFQQPLLAQKWLPVFIQSACLVTYWTAVIFFQIWWVWITQIKLVISCLVRWSNVHKLV